MLDKDKAFNDVKVLEGQPPYNSCSNICYGDGYFASSLERQYGMSIHELKEVTGYKERLKKELRAFYKKALKDLD